MSLNPSPDDFPYIAGWAFWGMWMTLIWGSFMFVYIKRWLKKRAKPCEHNFVFVFTPDKTEPVFKSMGYVKGDYTCDKCGLKLFCIREDKHDT